MQPTLPAQANDVAIVDSWPSPSTDVYDHDFYAWTQQQAAWLRARDFAQLDVEHLLEEVESMGRSERQQLTRRLEILLLHLLKWQYQPELHGRSWQLTIQEQRRRIARLLAASPSLSHHLAGCLAEAYDDAMFAAMRETGLAMSTFPETCPYGLEEVLGGEWLPG